MLRQFRREILWLCLCFTQLYAMAMTNRETGNTPLSIESTQARDVVVLIHGWASIRLALGPLGSRIRREGFEVVSIGYPSVRVPLDTLASRELPLRLERHLELGRSRVHFVTHSMGGLLVRRFLELNPGFDVGRVVMMGPPNHGSAIADWLSQSRLCRWMAGPNLLELTTESASARGASTPVGFTVGILAGDGHWPSPLQFLEGPHDGKVTVASTRIAGMTDHAVVHCSHTLLPWHPRVASLAVQFLKHGRFGPSLREKATPAEIASN